MENKLDQIIDGNKSIIEQLEKRKRLFFPNSQLKPETDLKSSLEYQNSDERNQKGVSSDEHN
jgi:hypothetical protein